MLENRFLEAVFVILRRDRYSSKEFLLDHLEGRDYYEDICVREYGAKAWTEFVWLSMRSEHGNEPSGNFLNKRGTVRF